MKDAGLTEMFTFALTPMEKQALARLAEDRGATMSGLIRKLIRDTAAIEAAAKREKGVRHARTR